MGVKCVKCGSNNTAEYLFGLPKMDDKLEKAIAEHKIVLGGCEVSDFDPKYYCNDCQNNFGYSSKRLRDGKCIDYIDETNYFKLSVNYVEYGETTFVLYREADKYYVEFYGVRKKYSKEISESEFKKNLSTIFERALVLEWDEKYEGKSPVDTTDWKIEIKCDNGDDFNFSGKNYFPPYFRRAKARHDSYAVRFEHRSK